MLTNCACLVGQGWLEDVSKVEKYVMSDADYEAREDTYRKFKEERLREVRLVALYTPHGPSLFQPAPLTTFRSFRTSRIQAGRYRRRLPRIRQ